MIPLSVTSATYTPLALNPLNLSFISPIHTRCSQLKNLRQLLLISKRSVKCRAELSGDAPVAMAIGACILNSLVFPMAPSPEDMEAEDLIDSADARFAVMGIISFIPYFNWMSWVFAWLDTGKQRYAVYAIVYLAPYLRSNLSISPDDSWLPIASILLCILHIQLEASAKNGDIQGFPVINDVAKRIYSITGKKSRKNFEEEQRNDFHNLPSAQDYRNEIRGWGSIQKPDHHETLDGGEEVDEIEEN